MSDPKITVLMPAYNTEKYIGEAIQSVLNQTFQDFELLIVNDGSTDGTENIIRSFTDERIRLINQSNGGVAAALNSGLLTAKANLVARFDADDICMPERLLVQYNFLNDNPDHIIVGCDVAYIDMNGDHVFTYKTPAHENDEIKELILRENPFIHSAVLFRKAPILKAGGYDINAYIFEDHLLWSRVIKYGKTCNLSQILLQVRLNPESITIDEKWRAGRFLELKLKQEALQKGFITKEAGDELLVNLKRQDTTQIKEGSYYLLLGKKYLWNNHQPKKARANLKKAIVIHPTRLDSYAIMALSFFPKYFIRWLYKQKLQKKHR